MRCPHVRGVRRRPDCLGGTAVTGEVQPWSAERVKAERLVTHWSGPAVLWLSGQFPHVFEPGQERLFSPHALWDPRAPQRQTLSEAPLCFLKSGPRTGTGTQGHPQTRVGTPRGTSLCLLAAGGLEPLGAEPGRGPGPCSPLEAGGGTDSRRGELDGRSGTRKPGPHGLLRSCSAGEQGPS